MSLTSHSQVFASINDSDISGVNIDGGTISKKYIVITHEPKPLTTELTFRIDNVIIFNGTPDSGDAYEVKRISETQTIIKRKLVTETPITVEVIVESHIGSAVIGSTFKIA